MSSPRYFYKFREFNTNTLTSLCENRVFFSPPGNFNDPLDCVPLIVSDSPIKELKKLLEVLIEQRIYNEVTDNLTKANFYTSETMRHAKDKALRESIKSTTYLSNLIRDKRGSILLPVIQNELSNWYQRGVFCLSTKFDCPLLWSHYGAQHKGICIGYKASDKAVLQPRQVEYGGERAIKTSELYAAFIDGDLLAKASIEKTILLKKAAGWEYEGEWRFIDKQGERTSPLEIANITFGLNCPASVMHAVKASMESLSKEITYYKMHTDQSSFDLKRKILLINPY